MFRKKWNCLTYFCAGYALALLLPAQAWAERRGGESIGDIFSDPQRLLAFFESRLGSYALVLSFFAAIVFFLRFLYGPKGIFRKSTWNDVTTSDAASLQPTVNTLSTVPTPALQDTDSVDIASSHIKE